MRFVSLAAVLGLSVLASGASAATLQVGPTRTYKNLGAVVSLVKPGDVVEVDGGATYPAVHFTVPGTAAAKITIRGIPVAGKRPIVSGGNNAIEAEGDHYVFEGLEITGGASRCFYHHADDITLRDSVVHDCPKQGILGADNDSGSLLLEYCEVYKCGGGTQDHQIYMATDESTHPGAVFRMQFCYVHDANGGNNVKSRAERNEIYYNWLEGALYHELELIGPDPSGGVAEGLKREDSDVVGNVLVKVADFSFVRTGGDGTGQSNGRYRFMNNTFVGAGPGSTAFRIFDGIDAIEMHDNVFFRVGGTFNLTRTVEAKWVAGEQIAGQNNWILTGMTAPGAWTGTLSGADPGFTNVAARDFTPTATSPLVDKGTTTTTGAAGHAFPSPLPKPLFHPPRRKALAPGSAEPRPTIGAIDIGAFEYGVAPPDTGVPDSATGSDTGLDTGLTGDTGAPADGAVDDGGAGDGGVDPTAPVDDGGGCGCRTASPTTSSRVAALALLGLALPALRRRRVR